MKVIGYKADKKPRVGLQEGYLDGRDQDSILKQPNWTNQPTNPTNLWP